MKASCELLNLNSHRPFLTGHGGGDLHENILLSLELDGEVGRGEGHPTRYYGETRPISLIALREMLTVLESVDAPGSAEDLSGLLSSAANHLPANASALSALDGALWDLLGRRQGLSVSELLGLKIEPKPTSYTLGLADQKDTLAAAEAAIADGFGILKMKAGDDEDLARISAVVASFDATVRVDVNGGWQMPVAVDKIKALADLGVELIEQPLAADDLEGYRRLAGRSSLPVVLDESVRSPLDLEVFAPFADGINLKTSKLGGISRCLDIANRARVLGLDLMLGCMVESSLGIAQALPLAPLARWLDLDGFLLTGNDPFEGIVRRGNVISCSGMPGLGIRRREG